MVFSVNEKRAILKRKEELDQYEEDLVRRHAAQQKSRSD